MKLAEALIFRADYNRRFEQLKQRLLRNAKFQEGDKPAEDPAVLLNELETISADLVTMIERINRTNLSARLPDGSTLTAALANRDRLASMSAF